MEIFTGLLSPGFISSCKSWIRNLKPAQRISIIRSDGADPAEVLLSEETPLETGHLRTGGGKTSGPPAGNDLSFQGINESSRFSHVAQQEAAP